MVFQAKFITFTKRTLNLRGTRVKLSICTGARGGSHRGTPGGTCPGVHSMPGLEFETPWWRCRRGRWSQRRQRARSDQRKPSSQHKRWFCQGCICQDRHRNNAWEPHGTAPSATSFHFYSSHRILNNNIKINTDYCSSTFGVQSFVQLNILLNNIPKQEQSSRCNNICSKQVFWVGTSE